MSTPSWRHTSLGVDLKESDVPVPDDIPKGKEMAALQAALDNLNEAYNSLYSPQGPIIASS